VWHCKDATADSELLGEATVCGDESSYVSMGERFVVLADTTAQLARKASLKIHRELGDRMHDAFIDKIVVGKLTKVTLQEFRSKLNGLSRIPSPTFKPTKDR
jgi:hypothetical protein